MTTKPKVKKLTDEEIDLHSKVEIEAEKIKTLMMFSMQMDIEMLKKTRSSLASSISSYEAIGIMEGGAYTTKLAQYRAKYLRLDSLIKFIDVLTDTNEILQKDPNSGIDISAMLGL